MQNKSLWEKVKETFRSATGKKRLTAAGLFIGLPVLVAVIGVAGITSAVKHNLNSETVVLPPAPAPEEVFVHSGIGSIAEKVPELPEEEKNETVQAASAVISDINEEAPEEIPAAKIVTETTEAEKEEKFSLDFGKDAEILNEFTQKPVKTKATGDWRAHKGIDIKTELMGDVFALESGKVTKIYDDPIYGKSVEVSHKDGNVCVYRNLDKNIAVNENDEIKKGDIIGRVGQSSVLEKENIPHLHFELIKDGKQVDPAEFAVSE